MKKISKKNEKKSKYRLIIGKIISTKMKNTAVILIEKEKIHRLYRKKYRVSKKYYAENPQNLYKLGEVVVIAPSKPTSHLKRWKIIDKLKEEK